MSRTVERPFADYTDVDGSEGEQQYFVRVFRRTDEPCDECGFSHPSDCGRGPSHAFLSQVSANTSAVATGEIVTASSLIELRGKGQQDDD